MAKTKISEFSATPANNTDIDGINIAEGCAPSGINDAIRELMAQLKDWQSGTSNDPYVIGSSGSLTLNQGTANGVPYLNGSKVVTSGSALTFDGTNFATTGSVTSAGSSNSGNLAFTGTGNRITGDFSNATLASRVIFQSSTTNGASGVISIPNGTGVIASWSAQNSSDVANGANIAIRASNTDMSVRSGITGTGTYLPMTFYTGGSEGMRIDTSGQVGIGTSSPGYRLDVAAGDTTAGFGYAMRLRSNATAAAATLQFTNSTVSAENAYIRVTDAGLMSFSNKAYIDSSGNLLVGKTATGDSTLGAELQASGTVVSTRSGSTSAQSTMIVYSTGASAYRFYVGMGGVVNATSTTITGISDVRLKENIRDLDDGLEKVMALQPRKFDWKEGKGADIKNARGFIAQEFEEVFPDMIQEWLDPAPEGEEPYKAVNANLIPTLVKAIQEQQAIITALTARVEALESN